jgi:Leucine-rich repeat (LRR) protein
MAVLKRVCEVMPRPVQEMNPELPPWLGDLMARLHAKAPADRFASAREVADLLARHLAQLQHGNTPSAIAQPPSVKLPAEKPTRAPSARPRRRWLMAGAVLLAPLAGLGLSEATGITNVRGRVIGLFSPEGTRAPAQAVAADAAWERTVAALPPEEQVKAVAARLKELNPGFDGKVTHTITGDVVTGLQFSTVRVTNIAPVRALTQLTSLKVSGLYGKKGPLADLSPLKGMALTFLSCDETQVSDLSPLKGMPLTALFCNGTSVSDLSPLVGMPLTNLNCSGSQVKDLSPLQGMRLDILMAEALPVSDLSPLRGMPLLHLGLYLTQVSDLSPLKGMPLQYLNLGRAPVSDLSPLKDMRTLQRLVLDETSVSDLSALKGLSLTALRIRRTRVSDLTPLQGMPLQIIVLDYRANRDAEVLRSLKDLEQINDKPVAEFWKAQEK